MDLVRVFINWYTENIWIEELSILSEFLFWFFSAEWEIGDDINTNSMCTISSLVIMFSFLSEIQMKWECIEKEKNIIEKLMHPKLLCTNCVVSTCLFIFFPYTLIIRSHFYSVEWCLRGKSNAHFILYFPSSHIHISLSSGKISLQRVYTEVIWKMPFVQPKPLMDRKMEWNRQKKKLAWLKGGRRRGGNEESHCVWFIQLPFDWPNINVPLMY